MVWTALDVDTRTLQAAGTAGDDIIVAYEFNETLEGGSGNDYLDGRAGADTMIGGTGNDTYVVDNVGDIVTENNGEGIDTVETTISYTLGANEENLTFTGYANINGTGNELDNIINGNTGANALSGGGGNDTLNGGAGADTMIGGMGNDTYVVDNAADVVTETTGEGIDTIQSCETYSLSANVEKLTLTGTRIINGTGNELDNTINGNGGANILDGGAGADALVGGLGNDTYLIDNVGDVVSENAGEGTDTVKSSISYILGDNLENLTLTGTASINCTGNMLNNTLTGNDGDNVLNGGAGNDYMVGGLGNDTYVVDSTSDVFSEAASAGTDTVQSSITHTLISNVENLTLTGTADINGTGNTLNNAIIGNSGNNVLSGGTGADTMTGGLGNDTYVVDNVGDLVTENAGEGIDAVQSSVTYTLAANVENLTLTGTSAISGIGNELDNIITGNSYNNTLTGDAGNDTLNGGAGADTMTGGVGNDTYMVDNAGDVVTEAVGEGTDTVQSTLTYTLGANVENLILTGTGTINGTDTVKSSISYILGANLENLTLTGTAAINGTGNTLNNTLTGNSGDNVLDGGTGNDTMVGGLGNDTYIVDSASDVVTEASSAGTDTVQSSSTYTLRSNVENLTLTGISTINGTGNTLNNILIGNSGDNILDGGVGNDTLTVGLGNDTLRGGLGNDTYLYGIGSGNEIINSYEGTSGNGVDTLQFQNLVLASIEFTRDNSDLVCTINRTGETVRLSNWTLGSNYQVDQIQFTDGTLTSTQVSQRIA